MSDNARDALLKARRRGDVKQGGLFDQPTAEPYQFYGGTPPHSNPTTSHDAAVQIKPEAATLRARVLDVITKAGDTGATDDEIEQVTGLVHQTASARRRELALGSKIVDSGQRRPTRSGRKAIVWIVAAAAS